MDKTKWVAIGLATYTDTLVIANEIVSAFESAYRLITRLVQIPTLVEFVIYQQVNAQKSQVVKYNARNWQKVASKILSGNLNITELNLTYPEPKGEFEDSFLPSERSGMFFRVQPEIPDKPLIVKLTIKRHLLDDATRNIWQDVIIAWGSEWFTRLKCIYGYMTQDCEALSYAHNDNPYESIQGIGFKYPLVDYRKWLPGYFWGNWISQNHIEQLGGLKRLRQEAPCAQVRDIATGNSESVFLQLTESIDNYSDESLNRLRRFLCPVVPRCDELPNHKPNTVRLRVIYADTVVGSSDA